MSDQANKGIRHGVIHRKINSNVLTTKRSALPLAKKRRRNGTSTSDDDNDDDDDYVDTKPQPRQRQCVSATASSILSPSGTVLERGVSRKDNGRYNFRIRRPYRTTRHAAKMPPDHLPSALVTVAASAAAAASSGCSSSSSSSSSNGSEQEDAIVSRVKASDGKNSVKNNSSNHEAWTEVMAPAHILQDEVHWYLRQLKDDDDDSDNDDNDDDDERRTVKQQQQQSFSSSVHCRPFTTSITAAEAQFLQTWAEKVHDRLRHQNELALESLELTRARKQMAQMASRERHAILTLQAQIRCTENENQQLKERIVAQQQDNVTHAAASRFLHAIDVLRQNGE